MSGVQNRFNERRKRLLEIGRRLVVEDGLAGMSIDRIATAEGCSRPTVYQHFKDREDVFEQIARIAMNHTRQFVEQAHLFQGDSRSKIQAFIACNQMMGRLYPDDFNIIEYLSYPWVQRQISPELLEEYASLVVSFIGLQTEVIKEALQTGDLKEIPGDLSPQQFGSQLLSIINGLSTTIVKQRIAHRLSKPANEWRDARAMIISLLDGCQWKPMTENIEDAHRHFEELIGTVFPEAWETIQKEDFPQPHWESI